MKTFYGEIDKEELVISKSELALRLGVPRSYLDENHDFIQGIEDVKKTICVKYTYSETSIQLNPSDKTINTDFGKIVSGDLCKNLQGAETMIVLCVSLGHETERLLKKLSISDPLEHFYADAAASGYVESAADILTEKLKKMYAPKVLCPRYSPGYGDTDISIQKVLLERIEAQKYMGITLSDSFLMIPQKTITAFHGVKK